MPISERLVRATAQVAGMIAPGPTGRAAFRLFCTPPRRKGLAPGEQRLADRMAPLLADAKLRRVAVAGGSVATYAWPATTPTTAGRVLLVHGWTGRALVMTAFVGPLRAAGFDCVAVDLPGHGESDGRVLNLAIGARAVQAVAESYGGITGIVAHSFGGPISALAAEGGLPLSHPVPVERMVLIASPNNLATVTRNFASRVGLPKGAMRALEDEILRIAGRPVETYEVGTFLARIAKPTLLIHDEGDQDVPFSRAEAIVAQAPHVELLRTQGLGHRKIVVAPKAIKAAVAFIARDLVPAERAGSLSS